MIVLSSLFVILTSHAVQAQNTSGNNGRDVVQEISNNREKINQTEEEKRKILGSLYDITKRMKKISHDKSQLTDKLLKTQGHVQLLAKDIAQLELAIDKQHTLLKDRMRNLYKVSGDPYLSIIFSQNSALSLDQSLKYLKIISDQDFKLIKAYKKNVLVSKSKKQNLNQQVKKMVLIENDIKKQEGLLLTEHKQKSQIVTEIETKKLANVENLKKLRQKVKDTELEKFDAAVVDLLKPAIYENKGQLQAPVQCALKHDFGLVRHEEYLVELSHKGYRYECPTSTNVSAIFEGKVVFRGYIDSLGETLIIDHGDHYFSVYASLSNIKVKQDELVKKSQILGTVNSTKNRKTGEIYFELRHFSEPENPKNWFVSRGVQISSME